MMNRFKGGETETIDEQIAPEQPGRLRNGQLSSNGRNSGTAAQRQSRRIGFESGRLGNGSEASGEEVRQEQNHRHFQVPLTQQQVNDLTIELTSFDPNQSFYFI